MLFLAGLDAPPHRITPREAYLQLGEALLPKARDLMQRTGSVGALCATLEQIHPGSAGRLLHAYPGVPMQSALALELARVTGGFAQASLPVPNGLGGWGWPNWANPWWLAKKLYHEVVDWAKDALESIWDGIKDEFCKYVAEFTAKTVCGSVGLTTTAAGGPGGLVAAIGCDQGGRWLAKKACDQGTKELQHQVAAAFAGSGADVVKLTAQEQRRIAGGASKALAEARKAAEVARRKKIREAQIRLEQQAGRRALEDYQRLAIRRAILNRESESDVARNKVLLGVGAASVAAWLILRGR